MSEFSIFGYTPKYIFYKDEKKQEFVIEIECPGEEDKDTSITAYTKKGKVHFKIQGKKIYPKEIKKILHKEDKPYSIFISVNLEKEGFTIIIDNINHKYDKYENGIYKKFFKIEKKDKNAAFQKFGKEKHESCCILI